jgi:carbon-monoxide dehydrogenase large subunit
VDGGQFLDNQRRCLAHADYTGFPSRRAEAARRGRLRGFGFANYLEANGGLAVARIMDEALPQESASIRFLPGGRVDVAIGTQSIGQDHARPVIELLSRGLGIDPAAITVSEGDTAALRVGGGTGGSKSLLTSSVAAGEIVRDVLAKGQSLLAERWHVEAKDVRFDAGALRVDGRDLTCTVINLARIEPGALDLESLGTLHHGSSANGCHAAEVEIDPETGKATLLAYTAVDDLGIVVNEGAVHGQVHGGFAQGLGQALLEEGVYDAVTGRLVPGSPMTYPLSRATDLPSITWVDNGMPSSTNALGAKACAETGASAAPPTIVNAVVDALAAYPGAAHLPMPARPEAIYRILRATTARPTDTPGPV